MRVTRTKQQLGDGIVERTLIVRFVTIFGRFAAIAPLLKTSMCRQYLLQEPLHC
jgi:hypothetical protein